MAENQETRLLTAIRAEKPDLELVRGMLRDGFYKRAKKPELFMLNAAGKGSVDLIDALLDIGKQRIDIKSRCSTTALTLAIVNGHDDLAIHLINRGADTGLPSVATGDALHTAVNASRMSVLAHLLEHKTCGDINLDTLHDGKTPLIKALIRKDRPMAQLLLQHGASLSVCDAAGNAASSYMLPEDIAARAMQPVKLNLSRKFRPR